MMADLIDRAALIHRLCAARDEVQIEHACDIGYHNGLNMAVSMTINAPTIEPENLIQYHVDELSRTFHYRVVKDKLEKQGEWKHFYGNRGQCSVCGVVVSSTVRNNGSYCPNCGAYMKGAGEDA